MEKIDLKTRSTREVLGDHLSLARHSDWETDLKRNFSTNCVLLTSFGIFRNTEGARQIIALLQEHLPEATYVYESVLTHGQMGFLKWSGDSRHSYVDDGADSYMIENGKIVIMTIHYTPKHKLSKKSAKNASG